MNRFYDRNRPGDYSPRRSNCRAKMPRSQKRYGRRMTRPLLTHTEAAEILLKEAHRLRILAQAKKVTELEAA